jgi:hypothetical protein
MNLSLQRLFFLSFLTISLSAASAHKSSLEFKQAVTRYIKHTDVHCLQSSQRHTDENVSYKKELRYLFKNYGNFSHVALLSRIRSAHQEMVKAELDTNSDVYKRYEQISSALLLTCAQVFFNDTRNQILNALEEIDNLIVYWRYQQHHQLSYFFSKSPTKWIMGKSQVKEVTNNLRRLERKQRELYTILGSLTEHVHAFTESGVVYDDCYAWIDELFEVLSCVQVSSNYSSDGTRFDDLAAELGLKIKSVNSLKNNLLVSLASAKIPNHFVRHWIAYTTALAAAGYAVHYNSNNPEVLPVAAVATQVETMKFLNLLIDPFKKIYERAKVAFSPTIFNDVKSQIVEGQEDNFAHLSLDDLFNQLEEVGKEIKSDIAQELAKSNTSLRDDAIDILNEGVEKASENWIGEYGKYDFDAEALKADLLLIKDKNDQEAYKRVRASISALSGQTWRIDLWMKFNKGDALLRTVNDYLDPLQTYTDIVDEKILKLIRLIAVLAEKLGREGDRLAKQADDKLQDNELTFMFTALIPLITTCFTIAKTYQWATKKNYSPIRIALADVNSLLIESAAQLDDHDYGKLVYLICKLRHRASTLKDSLSHEFLSDVAKLESKQYDPQIKRGIVENMFNKYAFLGRIAL